MWSLYCSLSCRSCFTDDYDMSEVKPYDKETFTVESETLLNFIKFRRSVRRFKDMPVEKEKIQQIIEAGRFTQTSTKCSRCFLYCSYRQTTTT